MRTLSLALAAVTILTIAGCGDPTRPPAPAAIDLTAPTLTFDAIGATASVTASVRDENDAAMPNATVTWTATGAVTVTPSATNSAVAEVKVTGASGGTVDVKAGSVTRSIPVVVQQAVATMTEAGSGQVAVVGTPLPTPVQVRLTDRLGVPIAGRPVTFALLSGGGSLSAATVASADDGTASVTWTLGTSIAVPHELQVSAGGRSVTMVATAVAGTPAALTIVAGADQSAVAGGAVPVRPAVRVTDVHGNPVHSSQVAFVASAGLVVGGLPVTGNDGVATVGAWVLALTPGPMSLTATLMATGSTVTFNATAIAGDAPVTLAMLDGDRQAGLEGQPLGLSPAVVVRDLFGTPVAGRTVSFSAVQGGGSVAGATVVSNASGVARVGGWTLGAIAALNVLEAAVSNGDARVTQQFSASGCTAGPEDGFRINLCVLTPLTATQRAAFVDAADRWAAAITGDLVSLTATISGSCGSSSPNLVNVRIDDLLIFAQVEPIDGPGQVLGSAGWCYRRSAGLPIIGVMRFDAADVAGLESTGRFRDVILHEMGHVLGIGGSIWSAMGFLQSPSPVGGPPLDTHFNGPNAIIGFDQIGGSTYALGAKVPVENGGGGGSINSHWRESVLGNELMTPAINAGSNPLTVLTILSLQDLGYAVNVSAATATAMWSLHAHGPAGTDINLGDDAYRGPQHTIDRQGRIARIR